MIGSEYLLRVFGRGEPRGAEAVGLAALRVGGLVALNAAGVRAVAVHVLSRQTPLALAGCAVVAAGVPLYFVLRRILA